MADELLSCPFCGGEAKPEPMMMGWRVICRADGCGMYGPYSAETAATRAIAAWNRRTPPTPATDEREAVARAIADALAVDPNDGREREAMQRLHDKCADAALSTLAQVRAAEILAAEANERARIVAWLDEQYCLNDDCRLDMIAAIKRNEHGAGK